MEMTLHQKMEHAVWVAHTLFELGKTTGATANLSFRHGNSIYITASGTCFGTLQADQFSVLKLGDTYCNGKKPSKELAMHLALYLKSPEIGAVIHTHGFYATLWSCLPPSDPNDCIPAYTPYLGMRLGKVGYVPYAKPGTQELFDLFNHSLGENNGYLLGNHGPIVGCTDIMQAFYAIEELEESAKIAWHLRNASVGTIPCT